MKCMDCGQRVSNWPDWLSTTTIEVRCAKCAGSGAHVINAQKPNTTIPMAEVARQPESALEAA